jgi:hypothetical protein
LNPLILIGMICTRFFSFSGLLRRAYGSPRNDEKYSPSPARCTATSPTRGEVKEYNSPRNDGETFFDIVNKESAENGYRVFLTSIERRQNT